MMKKEKEELGYRIAEDFEEMRGRFDEKPWMMLVAYALMSLFLIISIGTLKEKNDNIVLQGLAVANVVLLIVGALVGGAYMIQSFRKKGKICFVISVFLLTGYARLCLFVLAIILLNYRCYMRIQYIIGILSIIGAFVYRVIDCIYFFVKYRRGDYGRKAQLYSFSCSKKEMVAVGIIFISILPAQLGRRNSTMPQEFISVYMLYCACLFQCVFSRISLKAIMNLEITLRNGMRMRKIRRERQKITCTKKEKIMKKTYFEKKQMYDSKKHRYSKNK